MDIKETERAKPLFKKVIEKRSSEGDLQGTRSVTVVPYSFTSEKTGKTSKGYTMQIKVVKLGYGNRSGTSNTITIDPNDKELRTAIEQAYAVFDKINKI